MATQTVILLLLVAFMAGADATVFYVKNQCSFTVWAAGTLVRDRHGARGGAELTTGMTWQFNVDNGTTDGRVWARTGCTFDPSTGRGSCDTGDCSDALYCNSGGKPPMTMAEFVIGYNGAPDKFGISVVYGFNMPMDFSCSAAEVLRCTDVNCPDAIGVYGYDKYHRCQGNASSPLRYDVVFCP